MPCTVVSVVNRKGGVGKTSTTFHVAGYLANFGKKVLIIDNDPQHSLSTGIFGPQVSDRLPAHQSIVALFDDSADPLPEQIIKTTPFGNMSIVCGCEQLTRFNTPNPAVAGGLQFALKEFIDEIRSEFDWVLIDNAPTLQLCTWASLTASDFALILSPPEDYGAQGCVAVQKCMDEVLRTTNPELRLAGYVLSMVNRRLTIHQAYEQLLRQTYGDQVFRNMLPLLTHFKEAIAARKPLALYKPKSVAAAAVAALAHELMERTESLRNQPAELQYQGNRIAHERTDVKLSEVS